MNIPTESTPDRRKPRRILLYIAGAALVLRLLFTLYTNLTAHFGLGEGYLYLDLSHNLVSGQGLIISDHLLSPVKEGLPEDAQAILASWRAVNGLYGIIVPGQPTAYVMPLYPLTLATLQQLFGDPTLPGQLLGAILGAMLVYVLGSIGLVLGGRYPAYVTAGLAAVHPHLIYLSWTLTPQMGFALCLALAVLLSLRLRLHLDWRKAVLLGAVSGIGWLLRTEGLAVLMALSFSLLFPGKGWAKYLQRIWGTLIAVIVCLLFILPWGIRNQNELGSFILISNSSGRIIYEYNMLPVAPEFALEPQAEKDYFANLRSDELPRLQEPDLAAFPNFNPTTSETERNNQLSDRAIRFISVNPGVYARLCWMRFLDFFRLIPRFDAGVAVRLATMFFFPVMMLLGLVGLGRRVRGTLPLCLLVLGFFAAMMCLASGVAYRASTFDIAWLPLAGLGGGWLWERLTKQRKKT